MDISSIVVAVLALIGTLAGSFLSNSRNSALIAYRLEQLEKKVQLHNTLVERVTILEKDVEDVGDRVKEEREEINRLKEEKG